MTRRVLVPTLVLLLAGGCERPFFDPGRATRPYPADLHRPDSVDIQVFRKGTTLEVVNSTPRSYRDCDVWVNQRYVRHVEAIPAGETVILSLWDFWDERGDRFSAGGFWRTREAIPVRLVEIQVSNDAPLVGLITIRDD